MSVKGKKKRDAKQNQYKDDIVLDVMLILHGDFLTLLLASNDLLC